MLPKFIIDGIGIAGGLLPAIGAYIPPDMVSGTILGTAFAIEAGMGPETALALSYPIAAAR